MGSILLVTASLTIAIILVFRRLYENIRDQRRLRRRRELERIIWGVLQAPRDEDLDQPPALKRGDAAIVCDLALNLLRPLRGEEATRIIKLLESWHIQKPIRSMLARGSRGQRIRMLTLLAHFEDAESLTLLERWIGASDLYTQLAALRSLAARSAVESLPVILKQLERAKTHNAIMLADVLERFGEPAIDFLTQLAAGNAQIDIRLAAVTALGAIGSLSTVPALIVLARDPVGEIRAHATAALGRLGDTRALPVVSQGLEDEDETVRLQAAQAAGRFQMQTAIPALIRLMGDSFWWVRYRAAEALYRMGGSGATLLRSASNEDSLAGRIAAQVLAEMEFVR